MAKRSVGKPGRGGRKWAVRERTDAGEAVTERIRPAPPAGTPARPTGVLLRELVRDGKIMGAEPLADARARHIAVLGELPGYALQLSRGYPAIPTIFGRDGENAEAQYPARATHR